MPAAETDPSGDADTVEGIAAALRTDPVLVHETVGNGRTDEVHAGLSELVADLADAGVPAYVALVQTPNLQLATDRPADDLMRLVHQELDEPGVYVVGTPDSLIGVATYDVPLDVTDLSLGRYDALDVARADLAEGEFVPAAGEAAILLSVAADDDHSLTPADVDDLMTSGPWLALYGDEPMSYELEEAQGEPLTPVVVAVACALTALVVGWRLLRARSAWAGGARPEPRPKPLPTSKAGAGARRPRPPADRTPQQARKAVAALRREVDTSLRLVPDEVHGCLEAAADLVGSDSRLEVVGALVLAEQGSARLRGDELPVRCYFDPRHGPSTRTVPVSGVSLPACAVCAKALEEGHDPDSLPVDDGSRPYWRADSIWAATGLGSIDPDLWRLAVERTR